MIDRWDVIVVGAGTAGAAAAALCSQVGLRVLTVDRAPLDRAGARWVNAVPAWAFDGAGIDRPAHPELRGGPGSAFHLVAGWGDERLVVRDHDILAVDMRQLVLRLHDSALEHGARLMGGVKVLGVEDDELVSDHGRFRGDFIVDASGLSGAHLLGQARPRLRDLCAAAAEVRRVRDPVAAAAFFARHGVAPGDSLCFTGVAGGFSIVNLCLEGDELSLLTGSVPTRGIPSGRQLLERFVTDNAWVGARVFGGSRVIPIRRGRDLLASGRLARVGDAACQVFPAHGSGIAANLLAARLLADALSGGGRPWDYAVAWQRRYGGLFAAYDIFRRFSQSLTAGDIERLILRGLMDGDSTRLALMQHYPRVTLRQGMSKLPGLLREPALCRRMAGVGAGMKVAGTLYAAYPRDPRHLPAWSRAAGGLFGEGAEVLRAPAR